MKLLILIGISGSGKTTYATKVCRNQDNWIRVCRDDLREKLFCYTEKDVHKYYARKGIRFREEIITDAVDSLLFTALEFKQNVVIDATNLKLSYLKAFVEAWKEHFEIEFKVIEEDIKTCMMRDFMRERSVGPDVINRQHKQLKTLLNIQEFKDLQDEYRTT